MALYPTGFELVIATAVRSSNSTYVDVIVDVISYNMEQSW
jgi:hypothetical protein